MNDLAPREKIFIASGAIILIALLTYFAIILPQQKKLVKYKRLIPIKESQIKECSQLIAEYNQLNGMLNRQKQLIERQGNASFMQSYLEQVASTLDLTIGSMIPKTIDLNDEYNENQVEIKLERISLDSLIIFLHKLENSKKLLAIKRLRIKRRYDNHSLSDVRMTISTLSLKIIS